MALIRYAQQNPKIKIFIDVYILFLMKGVDTNWRSLGRYNSLTD
jgi:hypothetical protein